MTELLTLLAKMNLMPCLTVAQNSVTLMLGSIAIIRDTTIEGVLIQAAYRVVDQPVSKDYRTQISDWIKQNESHRS